MAALRQGPRLVTQQVTARNPTEAETSRRRRAGHRARVKGQPGPVWQDPPVNGRPVKWYRYRGRGPFASEDTP